MKYLLGLILGAAVSASFAQESAVDAELLLTKAKLEQKNIAVFYSGSDWNAAGEIFRSAVWTQPSFRQRWEKQFLFTNVDNPDMYHIGFKSLTNDFERTRAEQVPFKTAIPVSEGGAAFQVSGSGWVVSGENPAKDRYTIALTPEKQVASPLITIDVLRDTGMVSGAHGRAKNGSFALSGIRLIAPDGSPVSFSGAWASQSSRNLNPATLIHESSDPNQFWNIPIESDSALLIFSLEKPLIKNGTYQLILDFQSKHAQHALGKFSVGLSNHTALSQKLAVNENIRLKSVAAAKLKTGIRAYPALALFDSEGRIFALTNNIALKSEMKEKNVDAEIEKALTAKKERDTYFESAKTLTGSAKAVALAKGILSVKPHLDGNLHDIYKPQFEEMKKSDPEDKSGYQRFFRLEYYNLAGPILGPAKNKEFETAETLLNKELNHPHNDLLSDDQRQSIYQVGAVMYRLWPEKSEKQWEMLEKGIKINSETHTGNGMRGYCSMHGRGEIGIPYGWFPKDCKEGTVDWKITMGVRRFFSHAGKYEFSVNYVKGTHGFRIDSVALIIRGKTVSESKESQTVSPDAREAVFDLELPSFPPETAEMMIQIKGAPVGGNDSQAEFRVTPVL